MMWYFHVKVSSICIPKNLNDFSFCVFPTLSTLCSFRIICLLFMFGCVIYGLKRIYLVFFAFRLNLFAQNQSFNFLSSSFVLLYNCATSCDDKLSVVSSAKLNIFKDVELLMSFTYTRNRIVPKLTLVELHLLYLLEVM